MAADTEDDPEGELTVAEVAAILRVSRMTVRRLIYSGELPAYRVGIRGRPYRVRRSHAEGQKKKAQPRTSSTGSNQ